jgi:hypothetical protein
MIDCRICNNPIEPERVNVLPNTVFCAACANKHNPVKPRKGVMCYDHKTGAEIQIMSADFFEQNKNYFIPIGARSVVKNFSKNVCA